MTLKDIIWGAVVVVVATAITLTILGLISGNGKGATFGAVGNLLAENYVPYILYNQGYNSAKPINTSGLLSGTTFQVGSAGTVQANQITTTCAMKGDISVAATSTGYAFCTGVTGVTSADNVIGQFGSTTGATGLGDNWVIVNSKASTTAGAIDFTLLNLTGVARTPSSASRIGSSTVVHASH